jgi:hypothetical protein
MHLSFFPLAPLSEACLTQADTRQMKIVFSQNTYSFTNIYTQKTNNIHNEILVALRVTYIINKHSTVPYSTRTCPERLRPKSETHNLNSVAET